MDTNLFQIHLGVTSKCNLNCPHCYRIALEQKYPQSQGAELSLAKAKSILWSGKRLGLFKVVLIYGEPLLYPYLSDLVRWILENNLDLEIATNASLLNKNMIKKLDSIGLRKIHISLDYPDERHDQFRGRRGLYEHILRVLEILKSFPMRVKIVSTMMEKDFESYKHLLKIANKFEVSSLYFIPPNPIDFEKPRDYYKRLNIMLKNVCRLIQFNNTETRIFIHDPLYPKICSNKNGWESCLVGKILHIMPTGDVSMCPFSQKIIGNVFREPLEKIFKKNLDNARKSIKILNKNCLSRLEKWGLL